MKVSKIELLRSPLTHSQNTRSPQFTSFAIFIHTQNNFILWWFLSISFFAPCKLFCCFQFQFNFKWSLFVFFLFIGSVVCIYTTRFDTNTASLCVELVNVEFFAKFSPNLWFHLNFFTAITFKMIQWINFMQFFHVICYFFGWKKCYKCWYTASNVYMYVKKKRGYKFVVDLFL